MCALHNEVIAKVPQVIKNSYVISSEGCTHRGDRLHFSKQGYKLLGARYAQAYLKLQGIDLQVFDPNFYIFLAFGQSNMEGQGDIEQQDREGISDRFKMMPAVNFTTDGRIAGKWYKANPPLCRDWARISPLDYFGRTLVEKLNETKSVGVINVAVGGCSIVLFDEDRAESYLKTTEDWLQNIAAIYGNNPFRVLVNTAKKAQEMGVIKGILLHQGESDNGDQNWPRNVKLVYDRLLEELGLKEEDVPLLVGELVSSEQGGLCYEHNKIIAKITSEIKNSFVISSEGCPSQNDGYHFNTEGNRMMGRRYGETMYEYLKNHNDA
jgi:lysophospholipase L1-like esterase